MNKILIVEDEENIRETFKEILSNEYDVKLVSNAEDGLKIIKSEEFDLLITDLRLPGMNGIDFLKEFKKIYPASKSIVITAFSSIETAVSAIKAGADEYIPKPFSFEEVEIKVKNLLNLKNLKDKEALYLEEKDKTFGEIIGQSEKIQKVKEKIQKVAESNSTVLITGETGVGKELVAYTIHKLSKKKGLFVPVHCAAYSKGVIESELFGHEKGAFTGAYTQRKGKIEYAENGTLFLDEIGDIPLDIQVKLLRVLENRTFERVGGNKLIKTNARIICATNKNLNEMIKKGEFREDLFYRINVFPIEVPPLRDRKEDILILVEYFLKQKRKEYLKITEEVKNILLSYSWPGNIRELQNIVERAIILSEGDELRVDLALYGLNPSVNTNYNDLKNSDKYDNILNKIKIDGLEKTIENIEKEIIIKVLKENNFNQTKTAEILKINRTTLNYKIQKYNISKEI